MIRKIGDYIDEYEIVEIGYKPIYKMRKRVTITNESFKEEYIGKSGWYYIYDGSQWVELDDYPGRKFNFGDFEEK